MNERIEELAKQCYVKTGSSHTDHFEYWKFAELIVQECIGLLETRAQQLGNVVTTVGTVKKQLQEHFGVDQ